MAPPHRIEPLAEGARDPLNQTSALRPPAAVGTRIGPHLYQYNGFA